MESTRSVTAVPKPATAQKRPPRTLSRTRTLIDRILPDPSRQITRAEFHALLMDESKKAELAAFLKGLGCTSMVWGMPSPLKEDRRLLLKAMREYVKIFGFFPNEGYLLEQGLAAVAEAMSAYGGYEKIRRAIGAERPRFLAVMPRTPNATRKAQPRKLQKKPGAGAEPAKAKATPPGGKKEDCPPEPRAVSKITGNLGSKFVVLSDKLPGVGIEDVFRVKRFAILRIVREKHPLKKGETSVALVQGRLKIPVAIRDNGRELRFREKDLPGLLLAVDLELGPRNAAADAITQLMEEFYPPQASIPNWLALKLWVAREFMLGIAGSPMGKLPESAVTAIRNMSRNKRAKQFFFETQPVYLPVDSDIEQRLRTSSSVSMDSVNY